MKRRTFAGGIAAALASGAVSFGLALPGVAAAQGKFPDHPVRLVLSHPAGSGVDSVARIIGERLQSTWGQPIVVDNKPGGQNVIGAQAVQHAPADGYTMYFSTVAALVTNSYMFKGLPYDPQRDFVPVAFVANSPFGVIVRADSPIKSFDDLLARAKAAPGKVSIANEGPKTLSGLTTRLLASRAKVDFNQIAYVSIGVATQDTVGGQTDALVSDLATVAPLIKQGRLRLLATTASKRPPGWENVPAVGEVLPGFDMAGWFMFMAPKGTPTPVLEKANKDINAILANPDVKERIHTIGPIVQNNGNLEQVAEFFKNEHTRWAEISKEVGLTPE